MYTILLRVKEVKGRIFKANKYDITTYQLYSKINDKRFQRLWRKEKIRENSSKEM